MNNLFDEFASPKVDDVSFDTIPLEQPKGTKVPNKFPIVNAPYRIAIIGEAPGEDEERCGDRDRLDECVLVSELWRTRFGDDDRTLFGEDERCVFPADFFSRHCSTVWPCL